MKRFLFFVKSLAFLTILLSTHAANAQQHCMSGDLKCGGGGIGWKPPVAVVKSGGIVEEAWGKQDRNRCHDKPLPADQCKQSLEKSKRDCQLTESEYNWAVKNELIAWCLGPRDVRAVCPCGCFEEGTGILADQGYIKIESLTEDDVVVSLSEDVTFSNFTTTFRDLSYIVSGSETEGKIYRIKTSDHEIGLTQHHGVLKFDGTVVAAKDLKVGDELVTVDGFSTMILEINLVPASSQVYNFLTKGDSNASHLVVANGLIVGDISWQNSRQGLIGEIAIRQ